MKLLSAIALTTLLAAGTAFAADAPAASAPTAKPNAMAAAPDHHCRDEANAKKLKGAARASYIKKCRADSKKS